MARFAKFTFTVTLICTSACVDESTSVDGGADDAAAGTTDEQALDCATLAPEPCDAEPSCRRLVVGSTLGDAEGLCLVDPLDVVCVPVDGCGGAACLACMADAEEDARAWVEDCACLPDDWASCGVAPDQPPACECGGDHQCGSGYTCNDGQCLLCDSLDIGCGCPNAGCPAGLCCYWENYCVAGTPTNGHWCE